MVNYYELLNISQSADHKEIEQAIKKTRRLWNNRANSPDSTIRAESERHIREIAEAERILLDDSKRRQYDVQLTQNNNSNNDRPVGDNNTDWEDEYFQAYNRGLNDYAAQIAQKALRLNDRDGRAWYLYGEALRRGGSIEEGIQAMLRATMFISDDSVYRQLGFAYDDLGLYDEALDAFKTASKLAPESHEYYALCSNTLRSLGELEESLVYARKAYDLSPNDDVVRREYFAALYENVLEAISYNRSSGKHIITNKVQLDYANSILKMMALTLPQDDSEDCKKAMDEIVKLVVDAESLKGGGLFRFKKYGYEYNYEISNQDTRASGKH